MTEPEREVLREAVEAVIATWERDPVWTRDDVIAGLRAALSPGPEPVAGSDPRCAACARGDRDPHAQHKPEPVAGLDVERLARALEAATDDGWPGTSESTKWAKVIASRYVEVAEHARQSAAGTHLYDESCVLCNAPEPVAGLDVDRLESAFIRVMRNEPWVWVDYSKPGRGTTIRRSRRKFLKAIAAEYALSEPTP